jgi:hypothetical protein
MFLVLFGLTMSGGQAQAPLDIGSPEAAFAGGPIHLSKIQTALLR